MPEPVEEDSRVAPKRAADAPVHAERRDQRHVRHAIDIPMDDDQAGGYEEKHVGFFNANPSPFAVAEPIRSPVKEPGPPATAMASMVFKSRSIILDISSNIGSNVCECVFL